MQKPHSTNHCFPNRLDCDIRLKYNKNTSLATTNTSGSSTKGPKKSGRYGKGSGVVVVSPWPILTPEGVEVVIQTG